MPNTIEETIDGAAPPRAGMRAPAERPTVLVLSSSLLTDRMFQYTGFCEGLGSRARASIWATSAGASRRNDAWEIPDAIVSGFPEVRPFREFPYNVLRRVNEFAWDHRLEPPSRISMWRHKRGKALTPIGRASVLSGRAVALARAHELFESRLERLLRGYARSPEAAERLRTERPAAVVTTGPFQFEQPAVVAAAKNLGIPTLAFIPSWDNITTKGRLVFSYDGYLVWSEQARRELREFYPQTRGVPVYVVGAPQFDVFFQKRFALSRDAFCARQGLDPGRPIVVAALGSPNMFREEYAAIHLGERLARGELGGAQLIIRPHPIHDYRDLSELVARFPSDVVLQRTAAAGTALTSRSQDADQILEWVNTFRHADVVVQLSSTVAVDAAIFDTPVVNLDFDPEPGQRQQALVKDVNRLWSHFRPIAESGGVWMAGDMDEMVEATLGYLERPELHRERRRWVAEYVCEYLDGRCGRRVGEALVDFLETRGRSAGAPAL